VQILPHEPVFGQVRAICASIAGQSGAAFVPEHVDALLAMKQRDYIWLEATSPQMETVLRRSVPFPTREFSAPQLVEFSS